MCNAAWAPTINNCCAGCGSLVSTSTSAGLVRAAAYGKRSLDDIQIADALTWEQRSQLEREAPARLPLPSGRSALSNTAKTARSSRR